MTNTPLTQSHEAVPGVHRLNELLSPENVGSLTPDVDSRPSGFDKIDQALHGGFAPEELVILAGRPGVGKSITIVQWARNLAKSGQHVALACFEHSPLAVICQLLLIELGESVSSSVESTAARTVIDQMLQGVRSWDEAAELDPLIDDAMQALDYYATNLSIIDPSERRANMAMLEDAAQTCDVLIVDHLGKVGDGHVGRTARRIKELAVRSRVTAICTTTVTDHGISQRRVRQAQLADAAAVSHESDVEILLNDKLTIVSKNHTAFDSVRADSFRQYVVFSIEKNRRGIPDTDIEFRRDFAHRRFDPSGDYVTEQLIDGVLTIN